MRERKHFPTFVLTFLLKGGLYQRMFLGRFFRDCYIYIYIYIFDDVFNGFTGKR